MKNVYVLSLRDSQLTVPFFLYASIGIFHFFSSYIGSGGKTMQTKQVVSEIDFDNTMETLNRLELTDDIQYIP